MPDAAIVPSHPLLLHRPKRLPHEFEEPIGAVDDQVRDHTLITLGNWPHCHTCSSVTGSWSMAPPACTSKTKFTSIPPESVPHHFRAGTCRLVCCLSARPVSGPESYGMMME